jgi:hypothetical protein
VEGMQKEQILSLMHMGRHGIAYCLRAVAVRRVGVRTQEHTIIRIMSDNTIKLSDTNIEPHLTVPLEDHTA